MNYWLVKSEPVTWSWDQQVKQGGKDGWTGVRNHEASNNMKAMALGDRAFFYHSNEGKEIVGIVEVSKLYHPDPTDEKGKFDEVIEEKGVTVLIDPKAIMFLVGTEMDYVTEKMKSGFVFHNPNEKQRCGCGESFHV